MSDKNYDVVIAGYADIETAKKDFDALASRGREDQDH